MNIDFRKANIADYEDVNNYLCKLNDEHYKNMSDYFEKSDGVFYTLKKFKEVRLKDLFILILLNNENNFSEEILLMRALTQLNIIPKSEENDTINSIDNTKENEKYLYFLLSKNKAKSVNKIMEPILFWKNLLKFKDLKDLKAK